MFLLFVVAAMAALAIDLVTFYTARSEAQQAADGAALAGARALANSGMTSNPSDGTLASNAESLAVTVAIQVARHNQVGGRNLNAGVNCSQEVCVSFPNLTDPDFGTNPHISVQVTRSDLPTFFSRIWGKTAATVRATATAEAYNPSAAGAPQLPIAPLCVKPWLLPNFDPTSPAPNKEIFDANTGAIENPGLLNTNADGGAGGLSSICSGDCSGTYSAAAWRYFPGKQTSFPAPTQALSACSLGLTLYQKSITGCIQHPVVCGDSSSVDLDTSGPGVAPTDADASLAASCLTTHGQNNFGDRMDSSFPPVPPFRYVGGNSNPIAPAQGADIMVSDSLVTVPVIDVSQGQAFTTPATVIGFVQLFLNPSGNAIPANAVPATIVNLAGCGRNAIGRPIQGNGGSAIPVRLITPQ